jgi:Protein of unknown function (DUF1501)
VKHGAAATPQGGDRGLCLGEKAVEAVHPLKDLHVTLFHLLGLNDNQLTYFHEGRYKQLSQTGGQVIRELLA